MPSRSATLRAGTRSALKGVRADFVAEWLSQACAEGLYHRGTSPWGSRAFPTEDSPRRPSRVVVDYRMLNRRLVRARYFVRHMDDIKVRLTGSLWYTKGNGAKGLQPGRVDLAGQPGLC